MNEENTLKLLNTFPILYSNFHANYPPERKIPFEFQCRDGWFNLVWEMSQKLNDEIEKLGDKRLSVRQVKEKFGILRVYVSFTNETIENAIREAMKLSKVTCEVCGRPGELRGSK